VTHSASLGWAVDRPLVVVVAEIDELADGGPIGTTGAARHVQERFVAGWNTVVRSFDPRAPVAGFAHEVVALLGVPADADAQTLVQKVVTLVSGGGGGGRRSFSTGVSRVVDSPFGLPEAYDQARRALVVGRLMDGTSAVAHFEGLGIFRLLSLVPDSAELGTFLSETLGSLAGDDPYVVDLRHTLQVLLDANLNIAETARRLHFHYNSLRYRVNRLERMLGPFTTDPNLRLNLLVALKVLQMRGI
jgi:purine catabolism regulator